ncbi:hypothetical protein HLI01_08695 [Rhizobium laguerreae]|uniref:hypothetical protein n=1 Tax=Rhizobium laguerreae TaxID=1076926 RepID=UPI0014796F51|nr:hypothetical protein [Rhizobium laguerreae]NNH56885.1 hypothetical protein [Rhizobium laguerreae]
MNVKAFASGNADVYRGMDLRDWFAGQALAGMLNSKALAHLRHAEQAATAYQYADAMLAARTKES